MERHRGEALPDQLWLSTMGKPLRVQMEAFASSPEEHEAMVATYVALQEEIHDGMVQPFAGVVEVLSELLERKALLALVTSKGRKMAVRTLGCCGLLDVFQHLVCGDEVVSGKPDPEPVLRAVELLGVPAGSAVWFVGDSPWDVLSGRAAGVGTAAVTWGPYERPALEGAAPDVVLKDPREIIGLLDRGEASAR